MIRRLKSAALLTTMMTAVIPVTAFAATEVSADSTTPLSTSSAGDITIADDAELKVTGATPITVNSNNSVTIEEDASVKADAASGRAAISVEGGRTFAITNNGTIQVQETFTPADTDSNGVVDGPIANASNRYGIRVGPGAANSGTITNNGMIQVDGLNSHGIAVESAFTGDIVNTGTIAVQGDYSIGLETEGVDGDIKVNGVVSVVGEGAQGVVVGGDVTGTVSIQGTVSSAVSFKDDAGNTKTLSRADLRVVAPVVSIEGDVDGGILLAAPPYDLSSTDADEDNDGITDSSETTGAINAVGESPALSIGGVNDVTVGGVAGRDGTFSLAVDGNIYATGYFSSFDSTAVEIGGKGGNVTLTDGIGVSGSVRAATQDSTATAILINTGTTVPSLSNSGSILASVSSSGEAELWAIRDLSGTLTNVENSGHIQALGSSEDSTIAIDLSANTTGVTITQFLNDIDAASKADAADEEGYDPANPPVYTSIVGDIVTGSGDDVFDISSGTVSGDTFFGAGDDTLLLSDDSRYAGTVHAGAGDFDMVVSDTAIFAGTVDANGIASQMTVQDNAKVFADFENAGAFTVNVEGGTLYAATGETVSFGNLNVGADGAIAVVVDGEEGTASSFVVDNATFATGSSVEAQITSLVNAEGTYRILTAGTMTGVPALDLTDVDLPILFSGELTAGTNTLDLTIDRKTAAELGLGQSESAIYEAAIAATANSALLEQSILQSEDVASLESQLNTLMPDYAGGVFDFVSRANRMASKPISDSNAVFSPDYATSVWIQPYYFKGSKDAGEAPRFKNDGIGVTLGAEHDFGFGYVGLAGAYTKGDVTDGDAYDVGEDEDGNTVTEYLNTLKATNWELAAHWRMKRGPLYAFARGSVSKVSVSSTRYFAGEVNGTAVFEDTLGDWDGMAYSATGGASYDFAINQRFTLAPKVQLEYFRLKEDGYTENGGGAIDLIVDDRTSDALLGSGSLNASYSFGERDKYSTPLTLQLEGGWRTVLGGSVGATTAAFDGVDQDADGDLDTDPGTPFTLLSDDLSDGWFTEARVLIGGYGYTLQLAGGAEQTQGGVDLSTRASFTLGF